MLVEKARRNQKPTEAAHVCSPPLWAEKPSKPGRLLVSWGLREDRPVKTVPVDLPDDVCETLRRSPSEISRDMRLAVAIDWYRRGLVSQERAAEIAGFARAAFLDELASRKIDVFQVDPAGLMRESQLA